MEESSLSAQDLEQFQNALASLAGGVTTQSTPNVNMIEGAAGREMALASSMLAHLAKGNAGLEEDHSSARDEHGFATFEDVLLALAGPSAGASASTFATEDSIGLENDLLFTPLLSPALHSTPMTSYTPYSSIGLAPKVAESLKAQGGTLPYELQDYDLTPLSSPALLAAQQNVHNTSHANFEDPSKSTTSSPSIGQALHEFSTAPARKRTFVQEESAIRPSKGRPSPVLRALLPKSTSAQPKSEESRLVSEALGSTQTRTLSRATQPTVMAPPEPKERQGSIDASMSTSASASGSTTPLTPSSLMKFGDSKTRTSHSRALRSAEKSQDAQDRSLSRKESMVFKKILPSPARNSPARPSGPSPGTTSYSQEATSYTDVPDGQSADLAFTSSPELMIGLHSRKTNHKAAEQKRRDCMKSMFEEVRSILPEEWGGGDSGTSKVMLLEKAHDYIVLLRHVLSQRDNTIDQLQAKLTAVRGPDTDSVDRSYASQTAIDLAPQRINHLLERHRDLQRAQRVPEANCESDEDVVAGEDIGKNSSTSPLELDGQPTPVELT